MRCCNGIGSFSGRRCRGSGRSNSGPLDDVGDHIMPEEDMAGKTASRRYWYVKLNKMFTREKLSS